MEVHFSKILLNIWLFAFLLFAIPITAVAWYDYTKQSFDLRSCYVNNVWLTMAYGILMFVLCAIGMIGSLCRIRKLQSIFNIIVNTLIVLSCLILLFYLLALPRAVPLSVWGRVYNRTVSLDKAYPPLVQTLLLNSGKWSSVKKCLDEIHFCESTNAPPLPEGSLIEYPFLLTGCCKPPVRCGLRNSSGNHWEAPATGLPPNDAECKTWTEINNGKCYDCDACKAGYIAKFHVDWKAISFYTIMFMFFIFMVPIFTGCGAFTELQRGRR